MYFGYICSAIELIILAKIFFYNKKIGRPGKIFVHSLFDFGVKTLTIPAYYSIEPLLCSLTGQEGQLQTTAQIMSQTHPTKTNKKI